MGDRPNQKIVCLCFDDSLKTHSQRATPILQKYGFKATFSVITSFADEADEKQTPYMTWDEIINLQRLGMDVESHSVSHKNLAELARAGDIIGLHQEIGDSKKALANHGILSDIFIYPSGEGASDSLIQDIVQQYYSWARGAWRSPEVGRYNLDAQGITHHTPISAFIGELEIKEELTILYYHDICEIGENVGNYDIFRPQFEDQMMYLKNNNFKILTLKEALPQLKSVR